MAQFEVNFYSYSLDTGADICVTIPTFSSCDRGEPSYTHVPPANFPVLYLLHGHGNDYRCWLRYTSVERLAEEQRIAVVTLNSQNKAYNNVPYGDNFFDFVSHELPEFITSMFPVSELPKDTYIAGLSMGGYGTLVHAFRTPERYCAYGAFSAGVLEAGESRMINGIEGIDPYEEAKTRVAEGRKLPKGYICCGTQDFLYERNLDFVNRLKALGVDFVWHPVDGYRHEWRYWDLEIANFLQWIPRTDYYADKRHDV